MSLKNGKVFTSRFVGTGPSSYEKRTYRAAVSQRLRNIALEVTPGLYNSCQNVTPSVYVSAPSNHIDMPNQLVHQLIPSPVLPAALSITTFVTWQVYKQVHAVT